MTVDDSLRERFETMRRARDESRTSPSGWLAESVEFGGEGGDSGGMDGLAERVTRVEGRLDLVEHRLGSMESQMVRLEGRMDRLETRMDGMDTRLRGVEQTLAAVNSKLDLLTSQVVAKLPSWWQMPAVIGATVALLTGLFAGYRWILTQGLVP